MRNSLICLILAMGLLSSPNIMAQEGAVDKKPMIEIFTSSTCPPCVSGNIAVDGVLRNNPGAYTLIKYQMNWPGVGDPYYMETSAVRRNYYAVTGVPHIRSNGFTPGYPQSWTQAHFDALAGKTNISITAEASVAVGSPQNAVATSTAGLTVSCLVEIKAHAAYEAGLKAYILVAEQKTFGNVATNGETEFHNVIQGYMVSSEGATLGALEADQVTTFDLTLDLTDSNTETGNDLTLVVFVQDPETMDVKQSEMVEISHPFVDYSASFNFFDEDFNTIDGGKISIALAGEEFIQDSKASASKLLPGTYNFEVQVPGLLPYDGEFTLTDIDVQQDIFLEVPPFFFYEDFERSGFPPDWRVNNPQGDYFVQYGGRLVYQKSITGDGVVYLILPKITIDQGCVMSFKAGDSYGRSDVAVGTITDPSDPGTYTEVVSYEVFNLDYMHSFGARLDAETVGNDYLCLKISSTLGNYFYIDNLILIENEPGHKIQFCVTDQNGDVLPDVEVIMTDEGIPTNTFGFATWRNCDAGDYNYAVNYKGNEIETGMLTVDGDLLKEISYNASGIEGLEPDPIHIYPNPAQDLIIVKGFTAGRVQILDIDGRLVKERTITGQTSIPVDDLKEGIYLVKISAGKETLTKKLFITK